MDSTNDAAAAHAGQLRLGTERDVAGPMLPVSVSWLQKDRTGAKIIPFIRLGDRVLYDLDAVAVAVRTLSIGGPRGRRGRIGGGAK